MTPFVTHYASIQSKCMVFLNLARYYPHTLFVSAVLNRLKVAQINPCRLSGYHS